MPPSKEQLSAWNALVWWKVIHDMRDMLIREAIQAGISRTDIAKAVGYSREHLYELVPIATEKEPTNDQSNHSRTAGRSNGIPPGKGKAR